MDKHAAAHLLEQIAAFLELKGDNEFRSRAFRNAAHAVAGFHGDLARALESGELGELKGVGPATLEVVRDWAATGRSQVLEDLKQEVPPGLVEMMRISGLGVTKIRQLHQHLAIETIADLEDALRDGRVAALPRFGARTAENILRGVAFLRRTSDQHLFHHAARQAEQLRRGIAGLSGVDSAHIAGSVRRCCELIRDIDLVVVSEEPADRLASRIEAFEGVRDVVGTGVAAFTAHLDEGMTADIYVTPAARFGNVLVRATGNLSHVEQLQDVARERGTNLDRPFADEISLYHHLGLAFIPPELREGRGTIPRAAAGALPRLVERGDLLGFLHCHTVDSDGTNTVEELADACAAAGYGYLGITDHSVAAAFAGGLDEAVIARQHARIDDLNRRTSGLRVLKGIEADILADGTLDYGPAFLDRFDFVIGSIHSHMDMDEEQMTERVLRAMDDPHMAIFGHPTGRLLLGRAAYPIDMQAVIARAAERGVAIEINADPQRLDLDWRMCGAAKKAGVPIPIGADAHSIAGMANVDVGIGIARKAGLTRDDVLNTRDADGFLKYARARRR